MQATLIYNPQSGVTEKVSPEEIQEALSKAGYDPVYRSTSREEDLDQALADVKGLAVVAGGDGTIRAVATRLLGRGVPISPLPLGTANNICKTLGISGNPISGNPLEIVAGLKEPHSRHFDICRVQAPWGEDYFLEAFGYGLYAEMLADYEPEKGKSVLRSISSIAKTLPNYESNYCRITLDGKDISGNYLIFETLNTTAFGPRIKMAPGADPGDGVFDVVRIREEERSGLMQYLSALIAEEFDELPSVEITRGSKLELEWTGFVIHVDGEVRPKKIIQQDERTDKGTGKAIPHRPGDKLQVEILPREVEFWIPKYVDSQQDGRKAENQKFPQHEPHEPEEIYPVPDDWQSKRII